MGRFGHGWRIFTLVAACILALSVAATATTYYIDYAAGSDSNSGTSTAAPWQHMPGMHGCIANCAKTTPKAGDSIILKGGVTWPNAAFPITWKWSGSSGSPIYIGVDKTWYAGSSWDRPIFDLGGTTLASPNVVVDLSSSSYVTFDNFEIVGFKDNGTGGYEKNDIFLSWGTHVSFTNNYLHAWVEQTSLEDGMVFFMGATIYVNTGTLIDHNYMNGSDATPAGTGNGSGSGAFVRYMGGETISNNVVCNVSNVLVGNGKAGTIIYNNDFGFVWKSFETTNHENIMEFQTDGNVIYNNLYHDTVGPAAWPMALSPHGGTDWVFNNVCWNIGKDCISIDPQANYPTYTANVFNNTLIPASSWQCVDTGNRRGTYTIGTVRVINNHCITPSGTLASSFCFNQGSTCSEVTNLTETTNVLQTTAAATAQDYTPAETFVYSPASSGNATVGKGTNLTSSWPSGYGTNDTSYACTVDETNQVVCPHRTSVLRSATWDAGAYLYSAGGAAPAAPKGLTAVVH
jgi:hypothetical protein